MLDPCEGGEVEEVGDEEKWKLDVNEGVEKECVPNTWRMEV